MQIIISKEDFLKVKALHEASKTRENLGDWCMTNHAALYKKKLISYKNVSFNKPGRPLSGSERAAPISTNIGLSYLAKLADYCEKERKTKRNVIEAALDKYLSK